MRLRFAALLSASAVLASVFIGSSNLSAQAAGGAVDCSKPAVEGPKDWMNTSYLSDTNPGGFKSINAVTVEGNKVNIRASFGAIWVNYTFDAKDIKSVTKGDYDDGLYIVMIDVAPFQFANHSGEKTPPPGMTSVNIGFPEEVADQAIAGLQFLHQKAACGK